MVEYRTFFLGIKLFINACIPLLAMEWSKTQAVFYYVLAVVFPLGVLLYIMLKKRIYFRRYLCKPFIPSMKLILFVQVCDFFILVLFYKSLFDATDYSVWAKACAAIHLVLSIVVYVLILYQKERNRTVISYTRHRYRLGIMARDIGGAGGLKKGQPVEIVQETSNGYIVKDSRKQDYELQKEDIEEILDVV